MVRWTSMAAQRKASPDTTVGKSDSWTAFSVTFYPMGIRHAARERGTKCRSKFGNPHATHSDIFLRMTHPKFTPHGRQYAVSRLKWLDTSDRHITCGVTWSTLLIAPRSSVGNPILYGLRHPIPALYLLYTTLSSGHTVFCTITTH